MAGGPIEQAFTAVISAETGASNLEPLVAGFTNINTQAKAADAAVGDLTRKIEALADKSFKDFAGTLGKHFTDSDMATKVIQDTKSHLAGKLTQYSQSIFNELFDPNRVVDLFRDIQPKNLEVDSSGVAKAIRKGTENILSSHATSISRAMDQHKESMTTKIPRGYVNAVTKLQDMLGDRLKDQVAALADFKAPTKDLHKDTRKILFDQWKNEADVIAMAKARGQKVDMKLWSKHFDRMTGPEVLETVMMGNLQAVTNSFNKAVGMSIKSLIARYNEALLTLPSAPVVDTSAVATLVPSLNREFKKVFDKYMASLDAAMATKNPTIRASDLKQLVPSLETGFVLVFEKFLASLGAAMGATKVPVNKAIIDTIIPNLQNDFAKVFGTFIGNLNNAMATLNTPANKALLNTLSTALQTDFATVFGTFLANLNNAMITMNVPFNKTVLAGLDAELNKDFAIVFGTFLKNFNAAMITLNASVNVAEVEKLNAALDKDFAVVFGKFLANLGTAMDGLRAIVDDDEISKLLPKLNEGFEHVFNKFLKSVVEQMETLQVTADETETRKILAAINEGYRVVFGEFLKEVEAQIKQTGINVKELNVKGVIQSIEEAFTVLLKYFGMYAKEEIEKGINQLITTVKVPDIVNSIVLAFRKLIMTFGLSASTLINEGYITATASVDTPMVVGAIVGAFANLVRNFGLWAAGELFAGRGILEGTINPVGLVTIIQDAFWQLIRGFGLRAAGDLVVGRRALDMLNVPALVADIVVAFENLVVVPLRTVAAELRGAAGLINAGVDVGVLIAPVSTALTGLLTEVVTLLEARILAEAPVIVGGLNLANLVASMTTAMNTMFTEIGVLLRAELVGEALNIAIASLPGVASLTRAVSYGISSALRVAGTLVADEIRAAANLMVPATVGTSVSGPISTAIRALFTRLVRDEIAAQRLAFGTVVIAPDISLVAHLETLMVSLQTSIISRVRVMIDTQFAALTGAINGMLIPTVALPLNPPIPNRVYGGYGGAVGARAVGGQQRGGGGGLPGALQGIPPGITPGGDTRTFGGSVVNTARYMASGLLMGIPLVMMGDAMKSAKDVDYYREKAFQNFSMKDPSFRKAALDSLKDKGSSNPDSAEIAKEAQRLKYMSKEGSKDILQSLAIRYGIEQADIFKIWETGSQGLDNPDEALSFTKGVTNLLAYERKDVSSVDNLAAGMQAIMKQFGLSGYGVSRVSDMMIKASAVTSAKATEIIEVLKLAGPSFAQGTPGEFDDLMATSVFLSSIFKDTTGRTGKEGGTFWRSAYKAFAEPDNREYMLNKSNIYGEGNPELGRLLAPSTKVQINGLTQDIAKPGFDMLMDLIDAAKILPPQEMQDILFKLYGQRFEGNMKAALDQMDRMRTKEVKDKDGNIIKGARAGVADLKNADPAEIQGALAAISGTLPFQSKRVKSMWEAASYDLMESLSGDFSTFFTYMGAFLRGVKDHADKVGGVISLLTKLMMGAGLLKFFNVMKDRNQARLHDSYSKNRQALEAESRVIGFQHDLLTASQQGGVAHLNRIQGEANHYLGQTTASVAATDATRAAAVADSVLRDADARLRSLSPTDPGYAAAQTAHRNAQTGVYAAERARAVAVAAAAATPVTADNTVAALRDAHRTSVANVQLATDRLQHLTSPAGGSLPSYHPDVRAAATAQVVAIREVNRTYAAYAPHEAQVNQHEESLNTRTRSIGMMGHELEALNARMARVVGRAGSLDVVFRRMGMSGQRAATSLHDITQMLVGGEQGANAYIARIAQLTGHLNISPRTMDRLRRDTNEVVRLHGAGRITSEQMAVRMNAIEQRYILSRMGVPGLTGLSNNDATRMSSATMMQHVMAGAMYADEMGLATDTRGLWSRAGAAIAGSSPAQWVAGRARAAGSYIATSPVGTMATSAGQAIMGVPYLGAGLSGIGGAIRNRALPWVGNGLANLGDSAMGVAGGILSFTKGMASMVAASAAMQLLMSAFESKMMKAYEFEGMRAKKLGVLASTAGQVQESTPVDFNAETSLDFSSYLGTLGKMLTGAGKATGFAWDVLANGAQNMLNGSAPSFSDTIEAYKVGWKARQEGKPEGWAKDYLMEKHDVIKKTAEAETAAARDENLLNEERITQATRMQRDWVKTTVGQQAEEADKALRSSLDRKLNQISSKGEVNSLTNLLAGYREDDEIIRQEVIEVAERKSKLLQVYIDQLKVYMKEIETKIPKGYEDDANWQTFNLLVNKGTTEQLNEMKKIQDEKAKAFTNILNAFERANARTDAESRLELATLTSQGAGVEGSELRRAKLGTQIEKNADSIRKIAQFEEALRDEGLNPKEKEDNLTKLITERATLKEGQNLERDLRYAIPESAAKADRLSALNTSTYGELGGRALLAGATEESPQYKMLQRAKLLEDNRIKAAQLKDSYAALELAKANKDAKANEIALNIQQLNEQMVMNLVEIKKLMQGTSGTFNLPSGLKAMPYFEAMTQDNDFKSVTARSGDLAINITIGNMTGSTEDVDRLGRVVVNAANMAAKEFNRDVRGGMASSYVGMTGGSR